MVVLFLIGLIGLIGLIAGFQLGKSVYAPEIEEDWDRLRKRVQAEIQSAGSREAARAEGLSRAVGRDWSGVPRVSALRRDDRAG